MNRNAMLKLLKCFHRYIEMAGGAAPMVLFDPDAERLKGIFAFPGNDPALSFEFLAVCTKAGLETVSYKVRDGDEEEEVICAAEKISDEMTAALRNIGVEVVEVAN